MIFYIYYSNIISLVLIIKEDQTINMIKYMIKNSMTFKIEGDFPYLNNEKARCEVEEYLDYDEIKKLPCIYRENGEYNEPVFTKGYHDYIHFDDVGHVPIRTIPLKYRKRIVENFEISDNNCKYYYSQEDSTVIRPIILTEEMKAIIFTTVLNATNNSINNSFALIDLSETERKKYDTYYKKFLVAWNEDYIYGDYIGIPEIPNNKELRYADSDVDSKNTYLFPSMFYLTDKMIRRLRVNERLMTLISEQQNEYKEFKEVVHPKDVDPSVFAKALGYTLNNIKIEDVTKELAKYTIDFHSFIEFIKNEWDGDDLDVLARPDLSSCGDE